jgi:hypothetical protein
MRRGMGAQLSTSYCQSGWSLLNPIAWFGGCVGSDAADIYQKVQYGTAPPPVVTPPAPTVALTSNANTPGAVYAGTDSSGNPVYALPSTPADNQAAIVAAQNAAIDTAVAGGYNPAGNLPLNALDLSSLWANYSGVILLGAGVLGALVIANTFKTPGR